MRQEDGIEHVHEDIQFCFVHSAVRWSTTMPAGQDVWSQFRARPAVFLARKLYAWHTALCAEPSFSGSTSIAVVCISDTHGYQIELPDGDLLIHAGDLTASGSLLEIQQTVDWLNRQPHRHKVVIAGNHEFLLDSCSRGRGQSSPSHPSTDARDRIRWGEVLYLQEGSVTLQCSQRRQVKIYGSPWTPRHATWAFQYDRAVDVWRETIPHDTDILVTHGPPRGHLDSNGFGCPFLLDELWRLPRKPSLHVFGHIHSGRGIELARFDSVQRAYDALVASPSKPVARLVYMLLVFLCARAVALLTAVIGRHQSSPSLATSTWMVNASIVGGGLRDGQRRKAIVVHI